MKLRVIGWTNDYDFTFEEGESSFAAQAAIIDDIRKHGYDFSGRDHQESDFGVPVLNDGKFRSFSQRGWGGVMAEAHGHTGLYDYASYSFFSGDNMKMPDEERNVHRYIRALINELLTEEEREYLYEGDYTLRYPHPELGEREIYTLNEEELANTPSCYDTVRQVPTVVYRRIAEENLEESYTLGEDECFIGDTSIITSDLERLRYLEKGDTVTVGERSFLVKDVDRRRDVSEKLRMDAIFSSGEEHEAALKEFNAAPVLIEISI